MRADVFLVEAGYAKSRSEAQAAIRLGRVRANGAALVKPSQAIAADAIIDYEKPHPYVSRGGVKLAAALDHFGLSPEGRVCLDLGASTGGFTQVLLQRGAARVYAFDVGHGQMDGEPDARSARRHARRRQCARSGKRRSAGSRQRHYRRSQLHQPETGAAARARRWRTRAPGPWRWSSRNSKSGRQAVGKGGIVRDQAARQAAVADIGEFVAAQPGWHLLGHIQSPIEGGDGNIEYLLAARKS